MAGTVILVLSEGFNDMAFLANQVIIEENGNDVIVASRSSDAIKGQESSAMTVALSEALDQDLDYASIIIIGGKDLENWEFLKETINSFNKEGKLIGALSDGIDVLRSMNITDNLSTDNQLVTSENIVTMHETEDVEKFCEYINSNI